MRLAPYALLLCLACKADLPAPVADLDPADEPPQTSASAEPAPEVARNAAQPPPEIVLDPLPPQARRDRDDNGMRRLGAHRELPELPSSGAVWQLGEAGGAIWRLRIRSPEAVALRLHFAGFHLSGGSVAVFEADERLRLAGERRYQADGPADDGEFWSDLIEGDTAVVEYYPQPGSQPGPVPFRIDRISHLWQSPLDAF